MGLPAAERPDPEISFVSRLRRDRSQAWLSLTGELDAAAALRLRERGEELLADGSSPDAVWLDIAELEFVDAVGARALVSLCDRRMHRCASFEVRGTGRPVRRVLDLLEIELPGEEAPSLAGRETLAAPRLVRAGRCPDAVLARGDDPRNPLEAPSG